MFNKSGYWRFIAIFFATYVVSSIFSFGGGPLRTALITGGMAATVMCYVVVRALCARRRAVHRAHRIMVYLRMGYLQEALPDLRTMVAENEWLAGPKNPITMHWRHELAETKGKLGHGDALNTAKVNLAYRRAKLGTDHPATLASQRLCDDLLDEINGV